MNTLQKRSNEEQETICCRFSQAIYKNDDTRFCVFVYCREQSDTNQSDKYFTAVGTSLPENSLPVNLTGKWVFSQKYGDRQFQVKVHSILLPKQESDVLDLITSLKIGIGNNLAHKMISYAGSIDNFWEILLGEPSSFSCISGISNRMIGQLSNKISVLTAPYNLTRFFDGDLHMTAEDYQAITRLFENSPSLMLPTIQRNPYVLIDADYDFLELDAFTVKHLPSIWYPDLYDRLLAATKQILTDAMSKSHVCLPEETFVTSLSNLLFRHGAVEQSVIYDFLKQATERGDLAYDCKSIYTLRSFKEETKIAEVIMEKVNAPALELKKSDFDVVMKNYESKAGFSLSEDQRNAVWTALTENVTIITGGPGTGKSTILDALLFVWEYFNDDSILLMAPTGKAAMRMTETTGRPALTIHSALQLNVGSKSIKHMDIPATELSESLIVIDECSMIDQSVMASLMMALSHDQAKLQHFVLVGDTNQLPSVGYGNILSDIISSNSVPVRRLNTIYRQGAGNPIIVNSGKMQAGDTDLDWSNPIFKIYNDNDDKRNMEGACKLYCKYAKQVGIDNVALLSPYHHATNISTEQLNKALQDIVNPCLTGRELRYGKLSFRVHDRVMQTANTEYANNGDIGTVLWLEPHAQESAPCLAVNFEGSGVVEYRRDQLKNLDLAYAMSIHKSQGSQWKVVIIVMPSNPSSFLRRNLIYTAITRSSRVVALVTTQRCLSYSILNDKQDMRFTNLSVRLQAKKI